MLPTVPLHIQLCIEIIYRHVHACTSLAWPDSWIGPRAHADQGSCETSLHHLCYWNVTRRMHGIVGRAQ